MISTSIPEGQRRVYSQMVLLVMCFCGLFVLSAQRINMSFAMVDMVNWTHVDQTHGQRVPCSHNYTALPSEKTGKFLWDYNTQCQILAAFLYGTAVGHWPAEFFAQKVKAKWLLVLGMLVSSACNFLTPLAANTSKYFLMSLQFVKALGQAVVMPSFGMIVASWVDSSQAAVTFMGYSAVGLPVGAFVTVLVSGVICQSDYGWEHVFYLCGGLGIVWCIAWTYLASDYFFPTPLVYGTEPESAIPNERASVPYRDILTSKHVWAFFLCSLATYWAFSFNLLMLPMYTRRVFGADMQWNYIVSSAPNLLQAFLFMAAILGSERLLDNKIVLSGHIRIFCMVAGFAVFSTCNVLLTFSKCSRGMAGFLNLGAYGFIGLNLAALSALPVDMSPNYAGILSSIINTAGPLFGSLLPTMVGILSETKEGIGEWNKVFYTSVLIGFIAMIIFLLSGPKKIEPWDEPDGDFLERNGFTDLYATEPTDQYENEPTDQYENEQTDQYENEQTDSNETDSRANLTDDKK